MTPLWRCRLTYGVLISKEPNFIRRPVLCYGIEPLHPYKVFAGLQVIRVFPVGFGGFQNVQSGAIARRSWYLKIIDLTDRFSNPPYTYIASFRNLHPDSNARK